MTSIRIKNILWFAPNVGVVVEEGALDVSPEELQHAVKTAFDHINDPHLQNACHEGCGPLADLGEISYEKYIALLKQFNIQDAGRFAKREHTMIRRVNFNALRSRLILAMIEAGVPYICTHPGCEIHTDLTIDHILPLSRGGTDDLSNLQFLCVSHNSSKSDKLF